MCFHDRRWMTMKIVPALTPYLLAIDRCLSPAAAAASISGIWCSFRRAVCTVSPLTIKHPFASLPLASISRVLSLWVPRKRWAGFTQPGLSHRCSTKSPGGISPLENSQETRCDRSGTLWADIMCPYPFLSRDPVHSQQPGPLDTFSQNRSEINLDFATVILAFCSPVISC